MKKVILLVFFLGTFVYSESCKKEEMCACGIENPQENLTWLNDRLQSYMCEDIYEYFFEGKEFIIIESCAGTSDPMKEVFDCDGNLLCTRGGHASGFCPLNSTFWETYDVEKILLFKLRISPN